jgi:prepilin peptidase CpaA
MGKNMLLVSNMENTFLMLLVASVAAFFDLRTDKIPNQLIVASLILGLVFIFITKGTEGLLMSLAGFSAGFLLILPGYLLRFTGAGDLKLMATLGIYGGPATILGVFVLSVITGALFILFKILRRALGRVLFLASQQAMIMRALLMTGRFDLLFSGAGAILRQRLPMAPFYALGCTLFILGQWLYASGS